MTRTDPTPAITDQEVTLLPLGHARADLLEEILAVPVLVDTTPTRRRPPPAWAVVGAAAAAVAVIAVAPTLGEGPAQVGPGQRQEVEAPTRQPILRSGEVRAAPVAPVVPEVPGGRYVGVEVVGWDLDALYKSSGELTIGWKNGDQWLEVVRYPADSYGSYFADRDAYREGTAGTLFGRSATTWPYSRTDHATMTAPADGFFFEMRASGMPLSAYQQLIGSLVQTDEAGFYEGLPDGTVTPVNRDQAVAELLRGVPVPDGFTSDDVTLFGFNARYHASAAVAGAVGCAWLDVHEGGSAAEQARAVSVLAGSEKWPLLVDIAADGGYAAVFHAVADRLRAGEPADDLRSGIC